MLFAMFYLNRVGIFGSLFVTVLLIVGLTFGLRLMKVSYTPAWAVAGVAILGAFFAGMGGGEVALLLLLFGIPFLGAGSYLIAKSSAARTALPVVGVVLVVGILASVLIYSDVEQATLTQVRMNAEQSMNDVLMKAQAAKMRDLREDYDRQRRELFDSRVGQSQAGRQFCVRFVDRRSVQDSEVQFRRGVVPRS
jgi:hypothetical protein